MSHGTGSFKTQRSIFNDFLAIQNILMTAFYLDCLVILIILPQTERRGLHQGIILSSPLLTVKLV